ncbi:unnamed protein product, partial [Ectocarpus sp. 12 AP-2014]
QTLLSGILRSLSLRRCSNALDEPDEEKICSVLRNGPGGRPDNRRRHPELEYPSTRIRLRRRTQHGCPSRHHPHGIIRADAQVKGPSSTRSKSGGKSDGVVISQQDFANITNGSKTLLGRTNAKYAHHATQIHCNRCPGQGFPLHAVSPPKAQGPCLPSLLLPLGQILLVTERDKPDIANRTHWAYSSRKTTGVLVSLVFTSEPYNATHFRRCPRNPSDIIGILWAHGLP